MGALFRANFTDVLRELDVEALDFLHDSLTWECRHAARLAFRAFRDAVDASMRKVTLKLTDLNAYIQYPSPLRRWPRCSSVTVVFEGFDDGSLVTPELAAWPFGGLSIASRQRITRLEIFGSRISIEIVPDMACHLPSLRQLNLSDMAYTGRNNAPMQRIYATLAQSCPQLEHLEIPRGAELQGIGALAGSLRKLVIEADLAGQPTVFQQGMASAIAELGQLEELRLPYFEFRFPGGLNDGNDHGLVILLNSLPPSVQQVQLHAAVVSEINGEGMGSINVRLYDSRIQWVVLDAVLNIDFASSLLLKAHALGPALPVLELAGSFMVSREGLLGLRTNQPSFHRLLQRSARVDVHTMLLKGDAPGEVVRQAVQLFGVPRNLEIVYNVYTELRLWLRRVPIYGGRPHGRAAAGPTLAGLQNEVLEAFCRGSGGQAHAPGSLDAVVKEVLRVAIDGWRLSGYDIIVLLRGAPLSVLGRGAALSDWLQQLSFRAAAVASVAGRERSASSIISSYLDSPAVSDVILQCHSEKAAAAVVAAVRSCSEYASIDATLLCGVDVEGSLWDSVSKVLRELYDSLEGSEMGRLERLLPLAEGLRLAVETHRLPFVA